MHTVQRIYAYTPAAAPAVFVDRLYPRGIRSEVMAQVQWPKALAPSAGLRRWYHAALQDRYAEFAVRYGQELAAAAVQAELAAFKAWLLAHPGAVVLTAVKSPRQSHVPVLLQAAGVRAGDIRWE